MPNLNHLGRFIIRSPLFPYNEIREDAPVTLDELLNKMLRNDLFLEAIFWASPSLYEWTLKMLQGKDVNKEQITRSLKKYLIRASSRCTPFGLFAGCSIGNIAGNGYNLAIDNNPYNTRKHVRIDMHFLVTLSSYISQDYRIWLGLKYYANTSIYEIGNTYRYVEYQVENGLRNYNTASIEKNDLLENILFAAKSGIRVKDILSLIDFEDDISAKEQFISELITSHLLVSELEVSVTNTNQLESLIEKLKNLGRREKNNHVEVYINILNDFRKGIAQLNENSAEHNRVKVVGIFKQGLKDLGIEAGPKDFFQVDLFKVASEPLTISEATIKKAIKGIEVLSRISPEKTRLENLLEDFKRAFVEKYETAEVPLAEVIDSEMGIGFPVLSSFGNISNSTLSESYNKEKRHAETEKPWHSFLQGQYEMALKLGRNDIVLQDEDIAKFPLKIDQLPTTFAAMLSFISSGSEAQILLQSVGGTTANNLLGRFCHLDHELHAFSLEIARKEQELSAGSILAEILHLPEARTGNILQRPVLREFEIPYLSGASVKEEFRLPITDLMVSVEQGNIVVRSRRLDKKIIPKLSSSHNYTQDSLPIYHFLCAIQHQGKTSLNIDWGAWAEGVKFLPRLSYKNIILKPASWKFTFSDFRHILESDQKHEKLLDFFRFWNFPSTIAITETDNQLVCHINRKEYQEIFLQEIKKEKTIHLIEWLHFDKSIVCKSYTNQVVLPLSKSPSPIAAGSSLRSHTTSSVVQRTFFPGSEWLYMKIYCGAHMSDIILTEIVKKVPDKLLADGTIDKFYFIRYTDPHYHIRLRLHLNNNKLAFSNALSCLYTALDPFTKQRLVWKVQLDTYTREIERYQPECMEISENVFFYDSWMFLNASEQILLDEHEETRLLYALKNVAWWFDTFQLSLARRVNFIKSVCIVLSKEFNPDLLIELDKKYRSIKNMILQFNLPNDLDTHLTWRKKQIADEVAQALDKENKLFENLPHYIHMSLNRWFKTDQRLQEYIVYYFLQKYYLEQLKRQSAL